MQAALAGVFLLSSVTKLVRPAALGSFLLSSGFPKRFSMAVCWALPPLEGLVAAWLLTGILVWAAALALTVLSVVFVLVLLMARSRKVTEACRCFGSLDGTRLTFVAIPSAALLGVAALALMVLGLTLRNTTDPLPSYWFTLALPLGLLTGLAFVTSFGLVEQISDFRRGVATALNQVSAHSKIAANSREEVN